MARLAGIAAIAWALGVPAGCATAPSGARDPAIPIIAPTGKLRVGLYSGSPTSLVGDAASADARGVSHDLGRDLARRMGVPFQPVVFPNNAKLLDAAKAGEVDVVLTNATPVRAEFLDFTPTVLTVEQGYLVPAGSRLEHFALGIPKGRDPVVPYLARFADAAMREGVVTRAVERAGLRGTVAGAP